MASAVSASACPPLGRGVAMQHNVGRVLLAAAGVGLLLHLGHNWLYPGICSYDWTSSWLGPWVGTPAVIAALALFLYPRAPLPAASATSTDARAAAPSQSRPVCSFPVLDCLAEACEIADTTARPSGLFKRLTRKLSSCRILAVRFGKQAGDSKAPHDLPFLRRKPSLGTKSPRPSTENLRGGHWMEHRSLTSRRHNQGLSRQDSGSVHGSAAQDVTSSHAEMSSTAQSSKGEWASSDAFAYTGHLAIDCLPYDTTESMNEQVKEVVTEVHLLQFGAMIGESSAELALGLQGAAPPVGSGEASLYGQVDCPEQFNRGWERIIEEHKEGLHYWVSRRHLRKGLFMYKSRTVYEQASPNQMVCFTFADLETRRGLWDDSATALEPVAAPAHAGAAPAAVRAAAYAQSSFMYARTRFPPPMSQREYVYARRVWYKPDDGGCYCISKAAQHPAPPEPGCRTARVLDFCSGFVIRAVPGIYSTEPAVEVSTVYFEDSRAHSGILNMGIRKAMWPMTQKSEKGLRRYIAAHAEGGLPFRRSPPFECAPLPLEQPAASCEAPEEASTTLDLPVEAAAATAAGAPAPPDLGAAEGEGEGEGAVDVFAAAGLGLRNSGMFSGYYPALTRRLHVTPILYAGYLGAWRWSGVACRLLVRSCMAGWELLAVWHFKALRLVAGWVGRWAARVLEGKAGAAQVKEGKGLRSFPLQMGSEAAGSSSGLGCGLSLRQRQGGQGRRLAQLATAAAKAVGLPLMHGLLSGRLGGGARGGQQPLRFAPATPPASLEQASCSAAASNTPSRRVRPVVVDGVVVGHCPPKQPRQPPRPRPKARTLLQVMLGLQPTPSDEAREQQPHMALRPLSRRIM